jgi:hypothetical protein
VNVVVCKILGETNIFGVFCTFLITLLDNAITDQEQVTAILIRKRGYAVWGSPGP